MKTSLSKNLLITAGVRALLGLATPADAGTVTANGDFGGAGSLRAQIASTPAGGTIDFAVTGTITLTAGELVINKNLTIAGPGAGVLTVSGNNAGRVFKIAAANLNVTISGLTIANGNSGTEGGAGVRNESTGTVNVTSCAIVNNTTATSPTYIAGGGIDSRTSGTLNVTNCTLSGNTAGEGGGLHLQTGPANLVNCTISGNTALEAYGGGISNYQSALSITHCTIVGNTSNGTGISGSAGGIIDLSAAIGVTTIRNSIVAQNFGNSGGNHDIGGTFTSQGYNLISRNNGAAASFPTGNPNAANDLVGTTSGPVYAGMGLLADNGGPTRTHALLAGSPALDKGKSFGVVSDQRGLLRPRDFSGIANAAGGDGADIGAFELAAVESLVVTTLADENDNTSDPISGSGTSLREAINFANSNAHVSTITFAPGLAGTINLSGALPALYTALNIQGPTDSAITVRRDTGGNYRIFAIPAGASVTISRLTLSNGSTSFSGGAIATNGTLTLDSCTLTGNTAAQVGGAIYMDAEYEHTTIRNCTLSGNSAATAGGGVYTAFGTTYIDSSTITLNTAPAGNGSGVASLGEQYETTTALKNSIVAGNTNTDVDFVVLDSNSVYSSGCNLIGDGNALPQLNQAGDQVNVSNPQLGPLASNGGPTRTHAPLAGSPALDKGKSFGVVTDQRGSLRPVDFISRGNAGGGDGADIGAFEVQNAPPVAGMNAIARYPTQSVSVPEATLLANDTDPEGESPLTIVSVGGTTQAMVSRANGYVFYDPAPGFTGPDSFSYVVADPSGATSNCTVLVSLLSGNAPLNATIIQLEPAPGGARQVRVRFTALPGRSYRIQKADALTPVPGAWEPFVTLTANSQGTFEIVDSPPLPPQRFYRALYP